MPPSPVARRRPSAPLWLAAMLWLAVGHAAAVTPVGSHKLDAAEATHLLLRTGFAPSPADVPPLVGRTRAEAVDALIAAAVAEHPSGEPPPFTGAPIETPLSKLKDDDERRAARKLQQQETLALQAWWLRQMRDTDAPLAERMTLFWHNHFATSQQKVDAPQGLWRQHQLLRSQALGDFRALLHGIARDPAMLIYLDGASNKAGSANENFAREVMELFTLGVGHYGERDVKEAARAFTGWTVDRASWTAIYRPKLHDGGDKTVLGQSGPLDGDAVLDILLAQPEAARFLTGKLWREFVSPGPATPAEQAEFDQVARRLAQDWQIAPTLRALLLTHAFWDPANRAVLVKSPVELVVGSVRQLQIPVDDAATLALTTARLGQALFLPPNVKGWPGYTQWIDSATLIERQRSSERLFRSDDGAAPRSMAAGPAASAPAAMPGMAPPPAMAPEPPGAMALPGARQAARRAMPSAAELDGTRRLARGFDAQAWLANYGAWPDREPDPAAQARIAGAVLAAPPVNPVPAGTVGTAWLQALTLDPAYQLK